MHFIWMPIAIVVLCCARLLYLEVHNPRETAPAQRSVSIPQAAPPCPWREAETLMGQWFPGAEEYRVTDAILSGKRLVLQERLERTLLPEENVLHSYVIVNATDTLGTVLTRRLKGPNGAIEIALGLNPEGAISHFQIQRLREPPEIADSLTALKLEEWLRGKAAKDRFDFHSPLLEVSPTAIDCARDILKAVRSLLVLHEVARGEMVRAHH